MSKNRPEFRLQLVRKDHPQALQPVETPYEQRFIYSGKAPHADLMGIVSFLHKGLIIYPPRMAFDDDKTAEEIIEFATATTRRMLSISAPRIQTYGPLVACFYDNDLPGYTGTRLYFPDLIWPGRDQNRGCFVVAFDRDFLVAVNFPAGEDKAALNLFRQIREFRRGYHGPKLLPDQHFLLTSIDGAETLVPIDVTLDSPLKGLYIPLPT